MFDRKEGSWALIVHGGAKPWDDSEEQANRDGVRRAVEAGTKVLAGGGSAVDAVEAAIRMLEDLPVFNAGHGSVPNEEGGIEMCSGIMDGRDLSAGAVGAIKSVRNPISVARELMAEKEVILVGEGALKFAKEKGFPLAGDEELKAEEEKQLATEGMHDTVGAVALDSGGNLAAGTSTGGLDGQKVGRIGDSPLPGGGLYADNHVGAVSFSGDGETIARLALAGRIMASLEDGEAMEQAIAKSVAKLPGTGGADADGGGIGIHKDGTIGWAHNSPMFAIGYATADSPDPRVFLKKDEELSG
ncbi:MAG TPA: isoaspartyl peptidase/L-asparaginase family protein [Allosphingosinicella sp.]|jgi:beta-aspartyl-peptidase (threonine type)|nr:isoaspartyl peptidase/L-asparaginase family protein [Allosphingosinicella sp.]